MSNWKEKADAKKKSVDKLIPQEWILPQSVLDKYTIESKLSVLDVPPQFLSAKEIEITEIDDVTVLLEALRTKKYSSVEVTTAFLHRAAICTQLTNCCTEFMVDLALKRAKELDEYLEATGKVKGPFHGLPLSLKDCYNVPGYDSTIGYVINIGNGPNITQLDIVTQILDLGAVPYVKTNIPMGMMGADSENNIFGRTLNPQNLSWTAGGSSGGEGALVKLNGSILGIGTDGAGSIRIPALCNGIYGFKPSAHRVPYGNQTKPSEKPQIGTMRAVAGPFSRNYANLKFFFQSILDSEPWKYDLSVLPVGHQKPQKKQHLTIGVVLEDPDFPVFGEVKKIYNDAVEKLKENGHKIVEISNFPSFDNAWRVALAQNCIRHPDDNTPPPAVAGGEPVIASAAQNGLKTHVKKFPTDYAGAVEAVASAHEISAQWKQIFADNGLDALILPPHGSTAPPHDTYGIAPYTCMWNLVDFPAVLIPYGKVETFVPDERKYPEILDNVYPHPDETAYIGGIGSIQVIGLPFTDENLLETGEVIDDALNGGSK